MTFNWRMSFGSADPVMRVTAREKESVLQVVRRSQPINDF